MVNFMVEEEVQLTWIEIEYASDSAAVFREQPNPFDKLVLLKPLMTMNGMDGYPFSRRSDAFVGSIVEQHLSFQYQLCKGL